MEIRQLQALIAVSEASSFTRAAEVLSLTQSAVTRQIAALESETRTRLFDRLGRSVVLTAPGRVLQKYAAEIIRQHAEALRTLEDVRSGVGGMLAVGASSTAAAYLLPALLHLYRQERPCVDISVFTGPSQRVAEMVADNRVDVGLLMDEPSISGLRSIKVAEYSIALIVYPDHPYVGLPTIGLSELASLPLILMQRGASLRRSADLLLGQTIQNQRISMELDNVEAIKKMIEAKLGASLLPMLSVKAEISAGTLVAVPISSPAPPRPAIVIVHREEKYVIGAMREFIQLLCKEIPTD